ncbi:MAG: hypothetical protein KAR05_02710 [Candidatus Omnitrophica bacterium]|nr:hypothetical protein [Candidatus Omnitrophota bacterium]
MKKTIISLHIICLLSSCVFPAFAAEDKDVLIQRTLDDYGNRQGDTSGQEDSLLSVTVNEESQMDVDYGIEENAADALQGSVSGGEMIIFDDEAEAIEQIIPIFIEGLSFNNADINQVIEEIEQQSGLIIVSDAESKGVISLDVKRIAARDALKVVLLANGLAYDEDDGILTIMKAEAFVDRFGYRFGSTHPSSVVPVRHVKAGDLLPALNNLKSEAGKIYLSRQNNQIILIDDVTQIKEMQDFIKSMDVPLETEVFQLQYLKAAEIAEVLKDRMGERVGQVTSDERANKIVVTDTAEDIDTVRKIIEALDVKKEILFETQVVQIDLSDEHQNGVDWEAIVADYHKLKGVIYPSGVGDISIGTLSAEDYEVLIDALDLVGEMNSFTSPGNKIVNNAQAYFSLKVTESDIRVNMSVSEQGSGGEDQSGKDDIAGTNFYIVPTIHMDGSLTMVLKALSKTPNSEIDIKVEEAHSIVIGSVFREQLVDSTKKFPLLGDIPFLGAVFRSRTSNVLKTEYIIFLKPKILSE